MIREALNKLEQFIRKYNPYFDGSFSDVRQDMITGFVMSGETPVFPDDTLGNYFYLRIPANMNFDYSKEYIIAEGVNPIGIKVPVVLVACIKRGSAHTLLENLLTTIQQYLPDDIKFTSATHLKEIVIAAELAKIPKENIESALDKVSEDYSIVSVSFVFTIPYQLRELNCIKTPC